VDSESERARDAEVEALLERALAPSAGAERRIVAASLASSRPRQPIGRWLTSRPALAGAVALLVVALVAGGLLWRPEAPPPRPAARGTITNEGRVMVIQMPGEPITLVGPNSEALNVPPGTASIVLLGEQR
jgi:hypothetical protein